MKTRLTRARWFLAASALLALLGSVALAATARERSDAVYPAQRIPLLFSHDQHLKADVECEACHDAAHKSVRAKDRLLPAHAECEACHEIDKAAAGKKVDPPAACETCHLNYDATVRKDVAKATFGTPNLIFNHQVHLERKVDCTVCHNSSISGTMADVGLATRYQLPKMETCLTCHNGSTAPSGCSTCHVTDGVGRLQLSFASGVLRPMQGDPLGIDHGPRFELNHGTRAKLDRATCMECHAERYCQNCHNGLQKPLSVHQNDYVTMHPVQARQDSLACQACHRYQSFCAACHERSGVGLNADSTFRPRNLKVHPDYNAWVVNIGPDHHAIAAARDIKQCMACHREESCTACHATVGKLPSSRGTTPHPDGFKAGCKAMAARNDRACLKCHLEADLQSKGCR